MAARKPVAYSTVSAVTVRPSAQATPVGVSRSKSGSRSSTPLSRPRRTASVIGSPVTLTTLRGGSPCRTRCSTSATAARPCSSPNGPSRNTGGLRVTHVVASATEAISRSCCTAEVPPPTTTTRAPRKPSGPGYCALCS